VLTVWPGQELAGVFDTMVCNLTDLCGVWFQVVKMCLFNTYSSKSVRLDEFEQVQIAATDAVANHLRDNWAASIKNIIK
jgi:hypothetical protein